MFSVQPGSTPFQDITQDDSAVQERASMPLDNKEALTDDLPTNMAMHVELA